MTALEKEKQKGNIIIALDKMPLWGKGSVMPFVENIITGSDDVMERTVLKVNDLLADLGMKGIKNFVDSLVQAGYDVSKINWMFDPKWNDIPNTVANYVEKLGASGIENVKYITIMASGGKKMMKATVETRNKLGLKTKILAVTVLTAMDDSDSKEVYNETVKHHVLKLAKLALESGVDGIVCSPLEAEMLREIYGDTYPDFEIITPGVRMKDSTVSGDDQKRTRTPEEAINGGSTHLVIGRPIIQSTDRIKTIEEILAQMDLAKYKESGAKKYQFEKLLYTGEWADLIKYIGAIYNKSENGKYVRLASKLLSDGYVNIGATERDFRVLERASRELIEQLIPQIEKKNKDIIEYLRKNAEEDVRFTMETKDNLVIEDLDILRKTESQVDKDIDLLKARLQEEIDILTPSVVMGAQMGSVRLSLSLAKALDLSESIYCEKEGKEMKLGRHDINLKGKNVILCEDVITKGSTLEKMIQLVTDGGGRVEWITCVVNRSGSDNFNGIPVYSCYVPEKFGMYYDETSVLENLRKGMEGNGYGEEFITTVSSSIPNNIGKSNMRRGILSVMDHFSNVFDGAEVKEIINKIFDDFERNGVLGLPEGVRIEEEPKAHWDELVKSMR